FSERPPSEVIDLLDHAIGTLEKRDVGRHPFPGLLVGNCIRAVLVFHRVEMLDVMSKGLRFEDREWLGGGGARVPNSQSQAPRATEAPRRLEGTIAERSPALGQFLHRLSYSAAVSRCLTC